MSKKRVRVTFLINFLESVPNIDFFTREELRSVVRKFKQDVADGKLDDVSQIYISDYKVRTRAAPV